MSETKRRRRRAGCPDELAWAAFHADPVAHPERARLLSHLEECDRCSALWEYLCEMDEEVAAADGTAASSERAPESGLDVREPVDSRAAVVADGRSEAPPAPPRVAGSVPRRTAWRAAVAAGVAALVTGIWLFFPPPPVGDGGDLRIRGGDEVLAVEIVSRDGARFLQWRSRPRADGYRLRVWNSDGEVVLERRLGGEVIRWEVDREALGLPETGSVLVEALRGSDVVARSDLIELGPRDLQ